MNGAGLTRWRGVDTLEEDVSERGFVRGSGLAHIPDWGLAEWLAAAPSFNGRTVGSEPINRGSNPWGATKFRVSPEKLVGG